MSIDPTGMFDVGLINTLSNAFSTWLSVKSVQAEAASTPESKADTLHAMKGALELAPLFVGVYEIENALSGLGEGAGEARAAESSSARGASAEGAAARELGAFEGVAAEVRLMGAAEGLPRMQGKSVSKVEGALAEGGFVQTKVSNSPGKNQTWAHPDGSEVRVHPYGNAKTGPHPSGNNAHVHKQSAGGKQLTDRGTPSKDPSKTHIGVKNPKDLPAVRNRKHGE